MNPFSFIDAHVHTALSDDSQCPMEEYWAYLESGQAKAIGFAEHWHPGIEAQFEKYPEFKRSAPFDNRTYKQKIEQGRAKGYTLYRGVELTYETQWHDLCMEAIRPQNYDYVMGSAHSFGGSFQRKHLCYDGRPRHNRLCLPMDYGAILSGSAPVSVGTRV